MKSTAGTLVLLAALYLVGGCARDPGKPPAPMNPFSKQQVLTSLCRMPEDFWRRRDVSMVELMHESGYPKVHWQITEADIEKHLRAHPELVSDWVVESDNNRGTPAWCLSDSASSWNEHKKWLVSYLTTKGEQTDLHFFDNRYSATAFFIKRYVDQMLPY